MPRLKQHRTEFDAISRLMRGYGLNGANLSAALGCAPATARKKLNDPKNLTLGDISRVSTRFGIPMDELRGAIIR